MKNRIGRIPMLIDFIHHSIDPEVIIKSTNNYYEFLKRLREEQQPITEYESQTLSLLSIELINGKRLHEVILLTDLLQHHSIAKDIYIRHLKDVNTYVDEETINSVENILTLNFFTVVGRKKYGSLPLIIKENDVYSLNEPFKDALENTYFRKLVLDVLQCAFENNKRYSLQQPFTLYKKYSRKDISRLLNWPSNEEGTLNGGRAKDGNCPILVNYHKNEDDYEAAMYMDEFLSSEVFKWCSTKNRTVNAKDMQPIIKSTSQNINVLLFVKKDNVEGRDFYYLGPVKVDPLSAQNEKLLDKGKAYSVVTMNMVLEQPVQYDIYHYLVEI